MIAEINNEDKLTATTTLIFPIMQECDQKDMNSPQEEARIESLWSTQIQTTTQPQTKNSVACKLPQHWLKCKRNYASLQVLN